MPDTATSTIAVHIVDSAKSRVASAVLKAQAAGAEPIAVQVSDGHYLLRGVPHGSLMLEASASGFEQQRLAILVRDPTHLVVLGLPRPGERSYTQGDSRLSFAPDPDAFLLLLRGHDVARRAAGVIAQVGIKTRATPERIVRDPSSGQYTWNLVNSIADEAAVVVEASVLAVEDAAKAFQDARIDVVITRLIGHGDRVPHGLGNEAVARFAPAADRSRIDRLAASHGFSVVRELHHAGNAFLLNRPGIPDYGVLDAIDALRAESRGRLRRSESRHGAAVGPIHSRRLALAEHSTPSARTVRRSLGSARQRVALAAGRIPRRDDRGHRPWRRGTRPSGANRKSHRQDGQDGGKCQLHRIPPGDPDCCRPRR